MARTKLPDSYARCDAAIERAIRAVVREQRIKGPDAEDFAQDARLHLIRNGCHVLRRFRAINGCTLSTYLHTVLRRVLLNARAREFGRWRPSAHARRLGPHAVDLERLTIRDGLPVSAAVAMLEHHGAAGAHLAEAIALLSPISGRHGKVRASAVHFVEGDQPGCCQPDPLPAAEALHVHAALERAFDALPADDRRLIEERYANGAAVGLIAIGAGMTRRQMYARYERIQARLRRQMVREGIDDAAVAAVLCHGGLDCLAAAGETEILIPGLASAALPRAEESRPAQTAE